VKNLSFHPEAELELEYSAKYYESKSKGLGFRFLFEIEKNLNQIVDHPDSGSPLVYKQIRRRLLRYFPFAVVYKNDPERIYILAVMHLSRKPGYWKGRK
jgi:plasmid stabilization system protein ParE